MMNPPRHTMAEGCCSAIEPCSHQRREPTTICETCQKAAEWAKTRDQEPRKRYFVSMYTDGPDTRWNVIDRQTQEWIRRFPTKEAAEAYIDTLERAHEERAWMEREYRHAGERLS